MELCLGKRVHQRRLGTTSRTTDAEVGRAVGQSSARIAVGSAYSFLLAGMVSGDGV